MNVIVAGVMLGAFAVGSVPWWLAVVHAPDRHVLKAYVLGALLPVLTLLVAVWLVLEGFVG